MPLLTQYFLPNHPGLGDHIRGSILLKKLADQYNYTYMPNFRCGLIKDFIDLTDTSLNSSIPDDIQTFYVDLHGNNLSIHVICRLLESGKDINIVSNIGFISAPGHPLLLDNDSKHFVRTLLKPTPELEDKINKFAIDNSISNKTIYHIRYADLVDEVSDNFIQFISSKIKRLNGNLLFSDNENIKSKLCEIYSPIITTTQASHFRNIKSQHSVEANMIEFFLLGMVKNIVTYSAYEWTSNFIASKAAAHNIPVDSNYMVLNKDKTWSIQNNHINIKKTITQHRVYI